MPKRTVDARELLPLTPVVLHILLALCERDQDQPYGKHGYAVAQEVETMTDGQIRMGPGTLYGSIQRMLASSLIEEVARPKQGSRGRGTLPDDDERRRYYRLTSLGHRALELEVARLARVVVIARTKHILRDPEPA